MKNLHTFQRNKQAGKNNGKVPNVNKIAILRTNVGLGDLLVCLPAVQSLSSTYPEAEITWLGLDWQESFLANRLSGIDRFIEVPANLQLANAGAGSLSPDEAFLKALRAENFDIIINFQAEEVLSGVILRACCAKCTVGQSLTGEQMYDRSISFSYYQHEILRHLHLVELLGVENFGLQYNFPVFPAERDAATQLIRKLDIPEPFIIVHPGATDLRRRWPAENFAKLADHLMEEGYAVVFTGNEQEAELIKTTSRKMDGRPFAIFEGLSLGVMAALQERSSLLISNDTGPLHLARTIGCPTIGLYWAPNVINWGPLYQDKHRQVVSWELRCPECGIIPNDPYPFEPKTNCEHHYSFVAAITLEQVVKSVNSLLMHLRPSTPFLH